MSFFNKAVPFPLSQTGYGGGPYVYKGRSYFSHYAAQHNTPDHEKTICPHCKREIRTIHDKLRFCKCGKGFARLASELFIQDYRCNTGPCVHQHT